MGLEGTGAEHPGAALRSRCHRQAPIDHAGAVPHALQAVGGDSRQGLGRSLNQRRIVT